MSLATYAAPFNEENKFIKNIPKVKSKRVANLLHKIHDSFDDDNLADFTPPPIPTSSGVQKTIEREGSPSTGTKPLPEYTEFYNSKIESFQPFFAEHSKQGSTEGGDDISKKLNDIIKLLEQQQESKTESVTEEIILYSFFGIFIIYLVDSFKRVGKYTR